MNLICIPQRTSRNGIKFFPDGKILPEGPIWDYAQRASAPFLPWSPIRWPLPRGQQELVN